MELECAVESFLGDVTARDLSRKTWRRYHDDLSELVAFLRAREITQLECVTADQLRAYLTYLLTKPNHRRPDQKLSPFSVEGKYRSLKTFFAFACTEGWIIGNPMARLRRNKLPKRIVQRLSEDQVRMLLSEVRRTKSPKRNMALLLVLVMCGLRRGEALGLALEDVNLIERKIRVMGKGRKERMVPLGQAVTQAVSDWLEIRPPSSNRNVFVNEDGSAFQAEGVRSLLNRIKRRLGLPRLYPHLLRHSFAKLYLKLTHDPKSLQQILGHSKASTTLDLYVEYEFEDLRETYEQAALAEKLLQPA